MARRETTPAQRAVAARFTTDLRAVVEEYGAPPVRELETRLVGTTHERRRDALAKATMNGPTAMPTLETTVAVLTALRVPRATVEQWTLRHTLDSSKYRQSADSIAPTKTRRATSRHTARPATYWKVPIARRTPFTGRSADLLRIVSEFDRGAHTVVLHGLPGMGKTQLAAHFAHFRASAYETVWWLHSADSSRARADLAELGRRVRRGTLRDDDTLIADALAFLRRHPQYLLIADGAEDPHIIGETIPDLGGHLLVTTNRPDFEHVGRVLGVRPIDRRASALLLTGSPRARPGLRPLLDAIDGFPLVLQQARGFVETTGISYIAYHRMLVQSAQLALTEAPVPSDYPRNAVAAWALSIGEAGQRAADAREFLTMLAWGADVAFPSAVAITSHTGTGPSGATTVSTLARFTLVTVHRGVVAVHGLLGAVLRDQDQPHRTGLTRLVRHLDAVLPQAAEDPDNRYLWAAALPHVLAACARYEPGDHRDATARAHLLNRAATYLQSRRALPEAERLFVTAVSLTEAAAGRDDPRYLTYLNDLTLARKYLPGADLQQVIDTFRYILDARTRQRTKTTAAASAADETDRDANELDYGDSLHNLGAAYVYAGRADDAVPKLLEAVEVYEALWTTHADRIDHPELARAYTNLAWAYMDIDDRAAAEDASRHALALTSTNDRNRDVERAFALSNLGVAIERTHPAEAAELHRRAAQIRRRIDGPNSPTELNSIVNRGGALREQAEAEHNETSAEQAARLHRQVLRAAQRLLRDEDLADSAENNLGLDLRTQARVLSKLPTQTPDSRKQSRRAFHQAESHLRAVLERRTARLPADHHLIHQSRLNLGALLRDSGNPTDAIALLTAALDRLPEGADRLRVFVLDHRAIAYDVANDIKAARADARLGLRLIGDDKSPHLVPLRNRFSGLLQPRRN